MKAKGAAGDNQGCKQLINPEIQTHRSRSLIDDARMGIRRRLESIGVGIEIGDERGRKGKTGRMPTAHNRDGLTMQVAG